MKWSDAFDKVEKLYASLNLIDEWGEPMGYSAISMMNKASKKQIDEIADLAENDLITPEEYYKRHLAIVSSFSASHINLLGKLDSLLGNTMNENKQRES